MKKLITLTALLLCAVVSTWAAATETTATLNDWTVDTGSGGSLTIKNNEAVINCGKTKGNAVSLISDKAYKNISKIYLTIYVTDRSKTDIKVEIGTMTDGVFSATKTISSSFADKKLTISGITISSNKKNTSGNVTIEPATSGYVRITMANASESTEKTGKFVAAKITAEEVVSQGFGGVKKGKTTLTESTDYTVSGTTITLTEAHKAILAPTDIKLINHLTYGDSSTDDFDVKVALAKNGDFFEGSAKIGATTYTVKVPVDNTTPLLSLSAASGSISLKSYQATGTAKVTLTGANLANGTFNAPTAEGVTVTPATVEITDRTLNQEFTITSSATTAASTVLNFAYAGAATQSYTLSYTKVAQRGLSQTDVTEATTWDWAEAGENTIELNDDTTPTKAEEFIMGNLPEVNNNSNFNSQALKIMAQYPTRGSKHYFQGNSIKFNTTVAGTIDVTFSNTGNNRPYRYLRVNGVQTDYKDNTGNMVDDAKGIAVPAGEVVIDFYIPDAADPMERSGDIVGTTMCRVSKIVFTPISASEVNIPVSAAGYATFYTDKALDFTGIEDITAYTATKAGNIVTFNKVMGAVPAKTGLLVKGKTTNVPVAASAGAVTNIMEGTLTEKTIDDGSFVLLNQNNVIGFYRATGFTARANSAWLPSTVAGSSVRFIGFDDEGGEATGIQEVSTATMKSEQVFNLRGQRVAAPQKGLYIVNGKKVILK